MTAGDNTTIREALDADFDAIWPIFHAIVSAGDTYAYDPATDREQARDIWMRAPRKTFVAEMGRSQEYFYEWGGEYKNSQDAQGPLAAVAPTS